MDKIEMRTAFQPGAGAKRKGAIMSRIKTTTRFADLGRVFKSGESMMLTSIARLAVLYEDLRLEITELRTIHAMHGATEAPIPDYRAIYFLRRAINTLDEFRRGLTAVRKYDEFKQAERNLTSLDANSILSADRFLQKNLKQINDFRNEFGAHIQEQGVRFAVENLGGAVGSITWNSALDGLMGLECGF